MNQRGMRAAAEKACLEVYNAGFALCSTSRPRGDAVSAGRLVISGSMTTPLYGGALVTILPAGWIDASDLRPVPDNQEVPLAASQRLLASGG